MSEREGRKENVGGYPDFVQFATFQVGSREREAKSLGLNTHIKTNRSASMVGQSSLSPTNSVEELTRLFELMSGEARLTRPFA